MPKGVEHMDRHKHLLTPRRVKRPLMPKGVEHEARGFGPVAVLYGEETSDAERR